MSFPVLFWLVAFSYLIVANFFSYPLDYVHKALPALILVVWVSTNRQSVKIVVAAFIFCAVGDLLLAITFKNNFISGLAAFMIAQLLFAIAFWQWRKWSAWKIAPSVLLVMVVLALSLVILPASGDLALPVGIYMLVIFCMAICALLATRTNYLLLLGAIMFMLSDSLIGINKFVSPLPFEHLIIMSSYYLALYLLAVGVIKRTQSDLSC